ncbi:methyltransferase domain-containing protein [Phragmitibacter flavus]|uniref:Methyltransferase domain-containing protein n=1 Tax=Phragmitibacter flavus TaxID=2576071 RepID=A0A5R8KKH9_9BACT|nr:class I SAM-dependent methyltransferase [Phragmitibacter flavus]TLD72826.1 methyltransferase domain-containing protein [Phragmitibacter flavus]
MCIACETQLNPEDLNAFGERFLNIMNSANLAMMMSIGYRTGLFEVLREIGPSTSAELAKKANLNERYVREWLGAVTTGGIVECDDTGSVFTLPAAHAAMLTDADGQNVAYLTQFIAVLGAVEDRVVECFRKGGGVPYSAYPRFHEVMATDSHRNVVEALEDRILPLMPEMTERLERGIEVLDVGCGQGRALLELARLFPNSQFTGFDLCPEPVAWARAEAVKRGLSNVTFEIRDLTTFHEDAPPAAFDWITAFDAIHDQARPDHLLAGIRRALKPDGLFLMQDVGASSNIADNRNHHLGPLIYTVSCMHCMTVSLSQGGLGVGTAWGEQMTREFLFNAGFSDVDRHQLEHDIMNYYYVVKP